MSFTQEEMKNLRKFKKAILDVLFNHCETFYIHCMPHERLVLGKRGLLKKEQTEGLILVFGPYSTRKLTWDDDFLECEMQFSRWEYVRIPFDCVVRMFDKSGQVIMQWAMPEQQEPTGPDLTLLTDSEDGSNDRSSQKDDPASFSPSLASEITTDDEYQDSTHSQESSAENASTSNTGAAKKSGQKTAKKSSKKSRQTKDNNVIEVDFTNKKKS